MREDLPQCGLTIWSGVGASHSWHATQFINKNIHAWRPVLACGQVHKFSWMALLQLLVSQISPVVARASQIPWNVKVCVCNVETMADLESLSCGLQSIGSIQRSSNKVSSQQPSVWLHLTGPYCSVLIIPHCDHQALGYLIPSLWDTVSISLLSQNGTSILFIKWIFLFHFLIVHNVMNLKI